MLEHAVRIPNIGADGKTNMSALVGLMGSFEHYVLGKREVSCFERIYPGTDMGKGEAGSTRMGAQSLRESCPLLGRAVQWSGSWCIGRMQ